MRNQEEHTHPMLDLKMRELLPDLKTIRSGEKVKHTFSKKEMERRLEKLRNHMAKEDILTVLFTSIHNIKYYSDFIYCSFGRPYGLVITQDGSTSISSNIDGGQPWRRTYGDNIVYTDWQRDNYFRAVQKLIPNKGKVGVEFDHLNLEIFKKIQDALPQAELVDIAKTAMDMRMIKSEEEIDLIKNGAQVSDIGGYACLEAIAEGVPEYEVALYSTRTMVSEIARRYPHTELMDTWTWFQSGINTDGAHNPVTTRVVAKGDVIILNCFSMISGYYAAFERTLFFESCTKRELEIWKANIEVHRRGLELVKPGAKCCDIAIELNEIYQKHNLLQYRTFGYGYSFGILCHYFGREAGLEFREDVGTVLEPNMIVAMEPNLMLPAGTEGAGGYREHDILVVTADGAENITDFPIGSEYNIIKK